MLSGLSSMQPRQLAAQVLNFALVLSTAFMLWKGLSVVADSSSPIVVVLSGSMEPAFQRGDLLFLWNRGQETQVGEVVVYNVRGKDIPIVHRVIRRFGGGGSTPLQLLTKGDNNAADDTELYARGQNFLDRSKDVIGSVVAYIPFVGYVTILLRSDRIFEAFSWLGFGLRWYILGAIVGLVGFLSLATMSAEIDARKLPSRRFAYVRESARHEVFSPGLEAVLARSRRNRR